MLSVRRLAALVILSISLVASSYGSNSGELSMDDLNLTELNFEEVPNLEQDFAGLDLTKASEQQVAQLYGSLISSETLQKALGRDAAKLNEAWDFEIGRQTPDIKKLEQKMSPFFGYSLKRAKEQKQAVLSFLSELEKNSDRLGTLGREVKELLLRDVVARSKEVNGRPDMDDPDAFSRAYVRLLFLAKFSDEIFLESEDSPLTESLALPAVLTQACEPGSPWSSDNETSRKVLAMGQNRRDVSNENISDKYNALSKARNELAASIGVSPSEIMPGADLSRTIRSAMASALAQGQPEKFNEIQKRVNEFVSAGNAAQKEESRYINALHDSRNTIEGEITGSDALDNVDIKIEKADDSNLIQKGRSAALKADLDFDIKLVEFEIAKGISVAAKYLWGLEPSYKNGYFTRIDRYTIKEKIAVGDIIKTVTGELPVYLNLSREQAIVFARQFKSQFKAAKALPYAPWKIPLTAKRAIELTPGDFVSIPVDLQMVTGINVASPVQMIFGGGAMGIKFAAGVSYVLSGKSRFNVLRLRDNKVRLRISAIRDASKNLNLGARASYNMKKLLPAFEIMGMKADMLNSPVAELIGKDLLKMNISKFNNSMFTWDFVFDLSDKEAVLAYEAIMKASWRLKSAKAVIPLQSAKNVKEMFVSDLRPAEALAARDLGKAENTRAVVRLFKGGNTSEGTRRNFYFGLKFINFEAKSFHNVNRAITYDQLDRAERFIMPLRSSRKATQLLFGAMKEETERTAYSVVPTDSAWNPKGGLTAVLSMEHRDRKVRRVEIENVLQLLYASVGREQLEKLCNPDELLKIRKGLQLSLTLSFPSEILDRALNPEVDDETLWKAIASTAEAFPPPKNSGETRKRLPDNYGEMSAASRFAVATMANNCKDTSECIDWSYFKRLMWKLRQLTRTRDTMKKADQFLELTRMRWMRTAQMRLITELIRPYAGEQSIFIHLKAEGAEIEKIDKTIGTDSLADLYHLVREIVYSVNDNSIPMEIPVLDEDDADKRKKAEQEEAERSLRQEREDNTISDNPWLE